jgi:hypothetical protein
MNIFLFLLFNQLDRQRNVEKEYKDSNSNHLEKKCLKIK